MTNKTEKASEPPRFTPAQFRHDAAWLRLPSRGNVVADLYLRLAEKLDYAADVLEAQQRVEAELTIAVEESAALRRIVAEQDEFTRRRALEDAIQAICDGDWAGEYNYGMGNALNLLEALRDATAGEPERTP